MSGSRPLEQRPSGNKPLNSINSKEQTSHLHHLQGTNLSPPSSPRNKHLNSITSKKQTSQLHHLQERNISTPSPPRNKPLNSITSIPPTAKSN
ncbi:Protein TANC1 [Clarias magur]|uniref:Protein TANC1 n=1 Tax=Clarias magur TaxID=1594786 RepID=A0A8J4XCQ1_CLAMG|nr:Protein TANC1 [Clarias magur]